MSLHKEQRMLRNEVSIYPRYSNKFSERGTTTSELKIMRTSLIEHGEKALKKGQIKEAFNFYEKAKVIHQQILDRLRKK